MRLSKYEPLPPIGSQSDDNLTNYRQDYRAHPLEKPYVHQAEQYHKPEGDMEKDTSYKKDYTG